MKKLKGTVSMAVQAAIPALGKSMSLRPSWATQEARASLDYAARPCIKKERKREVLGAGKKRKRRKRRKTRRRGEKRRKGKTQEGREERKKKVSKNELTLCHLNMTM